MKYYGFAALLGALFFPLLLWIAIFGGTEIVFMFFIYSSVPVMTIVQPLLDWWLPAGTEGATAAITCIGVSAWITWVLIFILGAAIYRHRNMKIGLPNGNI